MAGRSKRPLTAPVEPLRQSVQGHWASQLALHILDEEFGADVRAVAAAMLAVGACTLTELKAYLVRCSKAVSRITSEVINHAEEGVLGGGKNRMQGMEPEEVPLGAPASAERIRVCMIVLVTHRLLAMEAVEAGAAASLGPAPRLLQGAPAVRVSAASVLAGAAAAPSAPRRGTARPVAKPAAEEEDDDDTARRAIRYRLDVSAVLLRARVAHYMSAVFRGYSAAGCAIARVCIRRGAWFRDSILTEAARIHAPQTDASGDNEMSSANVGTAFATCKAVWERMVAKRMLVPDDGILGLGIPRSLTAERLAAAASSGVPAVARGLVSPSPRPAHGRDSTHSNTSEAAEADAEGDVDSRVLWRFAWETAMKRLRNDLVISYVLASSDDPDAADDLTKRVVDAICFVSESREVGYMSVRSNPVSVTEICDTVNSRSTTRTLPDAVNTCLMRIANLPCGALSHTLAPRHLIQSRTFQVEYRVCLQALQMQCILQHVADTSGVLASRIVRVLLEKGSLDDKALADACMTTQKEAREAAYSLTAKGYVTIAEIPKRNDHMPQHTYYVFSTSFHKLSALLCEHLHHTLLNLRKRLRMETVRVAAVEAQVDAHAYPDAAGADAEKDPLHNAAHLVQVVHEGLQRLRVGCLRVDEALLLMRDLHFPDADMLTTGDIAELYNTVGKPKR